MLGVFRRSWGVSYAFDLWVTLGGSQFCWFTSIGYENLLRVVFSFTEGNAFSLWEFLSHKPHTESLNQLKAGTAEATTSGE